MPTITRTSVRLSLFALMALALAPTPARADIFQSTTTLPPPGGAYTVPSVLCIAPVCLTNILVSGFQFNSDVFSAGDELVDTRAVFAANVFQNDGGALGASLGALSIEGTMDFRYFGRTASHQLGTFDAQITDFDFMGTFNAIPFEVKQSSLRASTGQTTVAQAGNAFAVSSFFNVFAELSLDNGPFVPGPQRDFALAEVPEPGSMGLVFLGLVGLAGAAARARERS